MLELPKARTDSLVSKRVDDEIVVYDEVSRMGHCLTSVAASVWERCDGRGPPAEIVRALGLPAATRSWSGRPQQRRRA